MQVHRQVVKGILTLFVAASVSTSHAFYSNETPPPAPAPAPQSGRWIQDGGGDYVLVVNDAGNSNFTPGTRDDAAIACHNRGLSLVNGVCPSDCYKDASGNFHGNCGDGYGLEGGVGDNSVTVDSKPSLWQWVKNLVRGLPQALANELAFLRPLDGNLLRDLPQALANELPFLRPLVGNPCPAGKLYDGQNCVDDWLIVNAGDFVQVGGLRTATRWVSAAALRGAEVGTPAYAKVIGAINKEGNLPGTSIGSIAGELTKEGLDGGRTPAALEQYIRDTYAKVIANGSAVIGNPSPFGRAISPGSARDVAGNWIPDPQTAAGIREGLKEGSKGMNGVVQKFSVTEEPVDTILAEPASTWLETTPAVVSAPAATTPAPVTSAPVLPPPTSAPVVATPAPLPPPPPPPAPIVTIPQELFLPEPPQPKIFYKNGNNGTVSCNTFCTNAQWGGQFGTCVSASLDRVPCGMAIGLLTNGQPLVCGCQDGNGSYAKTGNNGTVSCDTFCAGSLWGRVGSCGSISINNTVSNVPCDMVPGLLTNGSQMNCTCQN